MNQKSIQSNTSPIITGKKYPVSQGHVLHHVRAILCVMLSSISDRVGLVMGS